MPAEVTPPPRITQLLADFAAGLHYEELPEPVRRLMPMLLIDVFRAAAIGIRTPWAGTAAGIMRSLGGNPESSIFFRAERTDLVRAAYLNGVICGSLDWDDSHVAALIHPGVVIWPAALAIGEKLGVNGRELLTAVAIGYEVAIRIACPFSPITPSAVSRARPRAVCSGRQRPARSCSRSSLPAYAMRSASRQVSPAASPSFFSPDPT